MFKIKQGILFSQPIHVSVIIPVYNSHDYIEKAISTLLNQTLKNIEFIFVDDKSPDDSAEIIERYSFKDKRIRLIRNEKNLGPGLSRNVGIEAAYGTYVGFLDPDDYINPEFYEALYESATKTTRKMFDIAKGQFVRVRNNTYSYDPNDWGKYIKGETRIHEVFTWQHFTGIFRKAILDKHPDARYGNNSFGEDAVFLMKACYYSKSITFTNASKYFYHMRFGSLSTRSPYILLYNTYQYLKEIDDFLLSVKDTHALKSTRKSTVKRIEIMLKENSNFKESNNTDESTLYKTVEDFIDKLKTSLT